MDTDVSPAEGPDRSEEPTPEPIEEGRKLLRRYPGDLLARGLSDWDWLSDLKSRGVLFGSPFGDLFLQDGQGIWFLDTMEGTLNHDWPHPDGCRHKLNTPDGQNRYLMAGLAHAAFDAGLVPNRYQALCFITHPAIGGAFAVDNLELRDVDDVLAISGQLHKLLRELPDDADLSTVVFEPVLRGDNKD